MPLLTNEKSVEACWKDSIRRKVIPMSKQEFLDRLRMSLSSQMTAAQVTEHLRFYEDYINTEMRKGSSEASVLQMLGDPRLIARTIVDASDIEDAVEQTYGNGNRSYGYYQYRNVGSGYNQREEEYEDAGYGKVYSWKQKAATYPIMKWVWIILAMLIVFVIVSAIFSLVSFLLPFVIPVLIVVFIMKLFRDWLN